jgi:ABC-type antimicrobial peptide transport system permease subunit
MRLVMGQSMTLTIAGVAAGLALALMLSRFLTALLYGVGPSDPLTFIGAPLVLSGVAMIASFAPARRATNVDPLTALRSE